MAGYQSVEKSLAELAGLTGAPSDAYSAAQLLAQMRAWIDAGSPGGDGGDSGIIVSDSDPGAGNDFWLDTSGLQPVLKIRNAADDGWLVSGGNVRYIKKRVVYADFVNSDFGGYVPGWLTITAGSVLTFAGIRIIEAFNDPGAGGQGALDLNSVLSDGTIVGNIVAYQDSSVVLPSTEVPPFIDIGGDGPEFPPSVEIQGLLALSDVLISPMMPSYLGGGTTGIADIYLGVVDALPAADNAKLLPDVTDGVATITAPGTLEVGSGLVLTEPTPGTALIEADIPAVPVKLFEHFTDGANVTTGETDLYSDTLAAGQLAANGDTLELVYAGLYAGSATATAALKLYFGGAAIFNSGALAVSAASNWTIRATLIRVSASIIRYTVTLQSPGLAVVAPDAVGELTGLDLTATQVVKITGQAASTGAASNQITAKLGAVTYVP